MKDKKSKNERLPPAGNMNLKNICIFIAGTWQFCNKICVKICCCCCYKFTRICSKCLNDILKCPILGRVSNGRGELVNFAKLNRAGLC